MKPLANRIADLERVSGRHVGRFIIIRGGSVSDADEAAAVARAGLRLDPNDLVLRETHSGPEAAPGVEADDPVTVHVVPASMSHEDALDRLGAAA